MKNILGKNKTACSECIYFGNDRRLYDKQNTCKKFKEVCCAVNNGGDCSSFKVKLKIGDTIASREHPQIKSKIKEIKPSKFTNSIFNKEMLYHLENGCIYTIDEIIKI